MADPGILEQGHAPGAPALDPPLIVCTSQITPLDGNPIWLKAALAVSFVFFPLISKTYVRENQTI